MRQAWRPALLALLIAAGWTASLFFTGYRDVIYAPALLALLAAGLIAVLSARDYVVPRGAGVWLLFALWLYITISLTWSRVPFASLVTWLIFSSLPLVFFALCLPKDSAGWLPYIAGLLLAGLVALAGFAVLQVVVWPGIYGWRAHAPLIDPNNLAALLNLGLLPMLAAALCRPEKPLVRHGAMAASALLFAGLLATQSRGGLLCALCAAVPMLWTLRGWLGRRRVGAGVLAALVIFTLMQIPAHVSMPARLARFAQSTMDPNVTSRFALWRGAFRLIAAHPFAGTGFGTFYLYYPSVRQPFIDNSTGNWAHNDPLQFWAEAGVLAPLLLYGFKLATMWRTRRAVLGMSGRPWQKAAASGLACGLLAVALQAHVEFQLYLLPILIVSAVWLASLYHLTADAESHGTARRVWAAPFPVPLIALGIALPLILLTVSSAAGQYYFSRAQAALNAGHIGPFLDNTALAEKRAPGSFIDPEVALAGFYIDLLAKPSALFNAQEERRMFDTADTLLTEAQDFNPAWAEIDRKRAALYATKLGAQSPGAKTIVRAALEAAVAKDPMNFRARGDLAKLLMQDGQARAALDLLQTGLGYPHAQDVARDYSALMQSIAPYARVQQFYHEKTNP